ncbi:MAG: hypothetical protein QME94_07590, partial [Anaerolineae bacterium]|nr:hypothetical protein [Anaerolineae bacterium]
PLVAVVALAMVAVGGGAVTAVLPALVGDLAESERRGLLQGGLMTMEAAGAAAAPLAAYALAVAVPVQGAYLFAAVALVAILPLPRLLAGPAGRASRVGGPRP